jgi:hypothetical protein
MRIADWFAVGGEGGYQKQQVQRRNPSDHCLHFGKLEWAVRAVVHTHAVLFSETPT